MDILEARIALEEQRSLFTEKREEAGKALDKGDLDKAKQLKEEIDAIKAKIDELDGQVKELAQEDEQEQEEQEQEEEQGEQEEERKLQIEGEDEKMEKRQIITGETHSEQRDAFQNYLETRAISEGVTTDSGYVVVPEEVVEEVMELVDEEFRLASIVTVKQVQNGAGKLPVVSTDTAPLASTAELAENPLIGVTPFNNVKYDIDTFRGYLPISMELIADAGVDVLAEVKGFLAKLIVTTENHNIVNELKGIVGKTVKTLDEIKTVVNTQLSVNAPAQFLMGQSVYDEIDRIKDENGRYLLQESISSPSGKKLFGKDVVLVDDKLMPDKTTFFVGNFKEVVLFDRSQYMVNFENYMNYGQSLMVALRHDVQTIDDTRIKKLLFKPEVTEPTA